MFAVCVSIWVKVEHRDAFIQATLANARGTRQEPGNQRFDVLQSIDDPNRFSLYELYDDEAAFTAHQQTSHYLTWREAVTDWMAQPRQGLKHQVLFS